MKLKYSSEARLLKWGRRIPDPYLYFILKFIVVAMKTADWAVSGFASDPAHAFRGQSIEAAIAAAKRARQLTFDQFQLVDTITALGTNSDHPLTIPRAAYIAYANLLRRLSVDELGGSRTTTIPSKTGKDLLLKALNLCLETEDRIINGLEMPILRAQRRHYAAAKRSTPIITGLPGAQMAIIQLEEAARLVALNDEESTSVVRSLIQDYRQRISLEAEINTSLGCSAFNSNY